MLRVFENKVTGALAEIPEKPNEKTQALINHPLGRIIETTDDMRGHVNKRHCKCENGIIILLPEEEWQENIVVEEIE